MTYVVEKNMSRIKKGSVIDYKSRDYAYRMRNDIELFVSLIYLAVCLNKMNSHGWLDECHSKASVFIFIRIIYESTEQWEAKWLRGKFEWRRERGWRGHGCSCAWGWGWNYHNNLNIVFKNFNTLTPEHPEQTYVLRSRWTRLKIEKAHLKHENNS